MPERDPGPSVKDDELYEKLRDEGNSKEKSARIANAAANESRSEVGSKGGSSPSYEDWTVDELQDRAKELDITGYSDMNKDELIEKLRNH
ncbi:Rho termination factor N-terminal domain-containing protein [Gordonia sp. PKS22-38]|uniref:Rho termination factor N-terminal domain-containing protein n=1 Tax=Gordonia prachuapensis TaxID=3115651 RepID=A0ABU7N029_9ACTN|nr:Rho termination factor N-terminal domain-containing protein [Gordonia sp. PKS22-38]